MIQILLPLLSIYGFAITLSNSFKIRITYLVPMVVSTLILLLLVGSIINYLNSFTVTLIITGTTLALYSLWCAKTKKKLLIYKTELITLAAVTILYSIMISGSYVHAWDDLAFWGVFTKELEFYDQIYRQEVPTSILPSHMHYPRGAALFHYFVLYFTDYSEKYILLAHFFVQICFLTPLIANKRPWQTILLISVIFLFPVIKCRSLRSLYNDGTIAYVFSSVVAIYILSENKFKSLIVIIPILLVMPIIREIGLWLAWFALAIIASDLILLNSPKGTKKYRILIAIIIFCSIYAASYCWFYYFNNYYSIGRPSHSIEGFLSIIRSVFNDTNTASAVTIYMLAIGKILCGKLFLFIYLLSSITWYLMYKYANEQFKHFKLCLITASICFTIFIIWRLYIFILLANHIYGGLLAPDTKALGRYIISYIVIFNAINCAFLKKLLFEQASDIQVGSKIRYLLVIITIVISIVIVNIVSKMPKTKQMSDYERNLRYQSLLVRSLISKDYNIEYHFDARGNLNDVNRRFICHKLSYFLTPYYDAKTRDICISESVYQTSSINESNKLSTNINIEELLTNHKRYKCDIEYHPMYNYLKIDCTSN